LRLALWQRAQLPRNFSALGKLNAFKALAPVRTHGPRDLLISAEVRKFSERRCCVGTGILRNLSHSSDSAVKNRTVTVSANPEIPNQGKSRKRGYCFSYLEMEQFPPKLPRALSRQSHESARWLEFKCGQSAHSKRNRFVSKKQYQISR
jgi:hypothetical protein